MFFGRCGEERTKSLDGVAAPTNDSGNIGLARDNMKDRLPGLFRAGNDHLVGKFDETPEDKPEEFFHALRGEEPVRRRPPVACGPL